MDRKQMALFEIRAKRIRAGKSPEKLGEELGLNGKTIRNIEAGERPSLTTALKLAEWVGKDVLDVFPELIPDVQASASKGEAA
jgi:DNA-binding XRE family transcriptional regulator